MTNQPPPIVRTTEPLLSSLPTLKRADLVAVAHSVLGDPTLAPEDHVVEFGSRVLQAAGLLSNQEALDAFRASSEGERFAREIHEVFHVVAAQAINELNADS